MQDAPPPCPHCSATNVVRNEAYGGFRDLELASELEMLLDENGSVTLFG